MPTDPERTGQLRDKMLEHLEAALALADETQDEEAGNLIERAYCTRCTLADARSKPRGVSEGEALAFTGMSDRGHDWRILQHARARKFAINVGRERVSRCGALQLGEDDFEGPDFHVVVAANVSPRGLQRHLIIRREKFALSFDASVSPNTENSILLHGPSPHGCAAASLGWTGEILTQ
jgi:hypothetical protein